jgi:hypothetical protein
VRPMAPLSDRWDARIDQMVDQVLNVEKIGDVRELVASLSLDEC